MIEAFIASLLSRASAGFQVDSPEVERYLRAVTRLAETALTRWRAVSESGALCACGRCVEPAISGCMLCGGMTCLAHALVSPSSGHVVCAKCIGGIPRTAPNAGAPPASNGMPYEEQRRRHLKALGLPPSATDEDVRVAFRELSKRYHPDRVAASKKDAAHKKYVKLSEAFEWLKRNSREAA